MSAEKYWINIMLMLFPWIGYVGFRMAVFNDLRMQRFRKRDIRRQLKGVSNYWLYKSLHTEYGLNWKYYANITYLILWPTAFLLSLFCIFPFVPYVSAVFNFLLMIVVGIMVAYSTTTFNREQFGRAFVLFEIYKLNKRRNFTCIISDLFGIVLPGVLYMFQVAYLLDF